MSKALRDRYVIVGVGVTPTARKGGEGRSAQQLEAMAVSAAIKDAGLDRSDIDGAVHAAAQNGTDA
jgi:acetyl-CoA acetyltransferase